MKGTFSMVSMAHNGLHIHHLPICVLTQHPREAELTVFFYDGDGGEGGELDRYFQMSHQSHLAQGQTFYI